MLSLICICPKTNRNYYIMVVNIVEKKMIQRVLDTKFDWAWWIGFILAIVTVFIIKFGIMENMLIVLFYGIGHMTLLTFLGLQAIKQGKSNIDIGHRISTMGYLHTLIGTTVALILASNHNSEGQNILNQMDLIIVPIGSALITSIIGWAIGTELERSIHGTREDTIVDHALNNLSDDINYLGKELRNSTSNWMSSIDKTIEKLEESTDNLESKFEKTLTVSSSKLDNDSKILMDKYFSSFDYLFKQLENQIKTTQNSFNNSSDDATKIMTNLMVAFESIFKRMDNHAIQIEQNFKSSTNSANRVITDLSRLYQDLETKVEIHIDTLERGIDSSAITTDKAINQFRDAFKQLFSSMSDYSHGMQKDFEKSTDNAKIVMDNLSESFDKIFTQIGTVSTQWDRHINDMKDFSTNSNISLNNLLSNSKKIANEIEQVAKGMPNSAQILREVDSILEILRVIKENDLP